MNKSTLHEIQYVVSKSQPVPYFKDKFALDQLGEFAGTGTSVGQLKRQFPAFASKPLVKQVLEEAGNGSVSEWNFSAAMPSDYLNFVLTLGRWGVKPKRNRKDAHYQTSRSGYSLVLQLNFGFDHDVEYYRYLVDEPCLQGVFNYIGHPVNKHGFKTMAWSRIDVDFDTNEALIEEVQSDWFRFLSAYVEWIENKKWSQFARHAGPYLKEKSDPGAYQRRMKPYQKLWPEAMLHTTVNFIRKELGISKVWMHTNRTGRIFKELTHKYPPASLYSKLPKSYGFKLVDEKPEFLQREDYLKRFFRKARKEKWFAFETVN